MRSMCRVGWLNGKRHEYKKLIFLINNYNEMGTICKIILILSCFIAWLGCHCVCAQDFPYISPEELNDLLKKGDNSILVVDTQPRGAYKLGHIKGAINFPWAMEIVSPGDLPRKKTLVLYCDCAHEEDSTDVARQLEKYDYIDVKILKGGWSQWQKLGYPIEKNSD